MLWTRGDGNKDSISGVENLNITKRKEERWVGGKS